MIKSDTLLSHELIGLNIHILDDTSMTLTGVSGKIINETKNMLLIRTPQGTKMITKKNATKIRLVLDSGVCFITGSSLIGRPEDRITRNC